MDIVLGRCLHYPLSLPSWSSCADMSMQFPLELPGQDFRKSTAGFGYSDPRSRLRRRQETRRIFTPIEKLIGLQVAKICMSSPSSEPYNRPLCRVASREVITPVQSPFIIHVPTRSQAALSIILDNVYCALIQLSGTATSVRPTESPMGGLRWRPPSLHSRGLARLFDVFWHIAQAGSLLAQSSLYTIQTGGVISQATLD